eukprot:10099058-Lingulodinium_polyedra.AAC.1
MAPPWDGNVGKISRKSGFPCLWKTTWCFSSANPDLLDRRRQKEKRRAIMSHLCNWPLKVVQFGDLWLSGMRGCLNIFLGKIKDN